MFKRFVILFIFVISFFIAQIFIQVWSASDGKLHIVVCDVGQGEGIYIRTPKGANILFDGGPDEAIISCLSSYMPFWERDINLMILSHPHADHYTGLLSVLRRYKVEKFITEDVGGDQSALEPLHKAVGDEKIAWDTVYAGDILRTSDGVTLRIIGPTKNFLDSKRRSGVVDPSDVSLQILVTYGSFDAFLAGDSNVDQMEETLSMSLPAIEMLQTPHHGSKNGLNANIVKVLHPGWASISVGKNNYGHPSPTVLDIYRDANIPYQRTDQKGSLRLITDGKTYNLK